MMLDPTKHNYFKKLMKLVAEAQLSAGSLAAVDIYHDDWCGVYRGQYCNCDPQIKLGGDIFPDPRRN
jgi:hypothetical protein